MGQREKKVQSLWTWEKDNFTCLFNEYKDKGRIYTSTQLLKLLEDKDNSNNPILQWENLFEKADTCKLSGEYSEAIKILEQLVFDMTNCKGNAAQSYLPMVYSALGENYFRLDKYDLAYDLTHLALDKCQNAGDVEGVISNSGNLSEICKRLNKNNEAINWIIISTNIMIQIGQIEEAIQLRNYNNIEPSDELITLNPSTE